MFFGILKKDLQRKKGLNIIVLIFIILATTFFAGSTNCLIASTNSLDKFMEISKTPDIAFVFKQTENIEDSINETLKNPVFKEPEVLKAQMVPTKQFLRSDGESIESLPTIVVCRDNTKYGLLFDQNDEQIHLKKGEIALPISVLTDNDIKLGDTITLDTGTDRFEFKVAAFVKDSMFGSDFMSVKRIAISQEDYSYVSEKLNKDYSCICVLSDSDDVKAAQELLREREYQTLLDVTESIFKWTYVLNLLLSIVFMLVSICLILIAFFALRFTIVFTLEGDFKEIGVMKAIGVTNFTIRAIYITKYIFIAVIGAALGAVLSFSFEKFLMREMSRSFVLGKYNLWFVNILCAVFIIFIITLFCFSSTGKLKKFSAIDAIRNGQNGERFKSKSALKLEKRKNMPVFIYLALNDVLSNPRKYLMMIMTFSLSVLLIMPTVNSANTFKSDEMVSYVGFAQSDYFYKDGEKTAQLIADNASKDDFKQYLKQIETQLADNGIDARALMELQFALNVSVERDGVKSNIFSLQGIGSDIEKDYVYLDGTPPKLRNEIAMTKVLMDEFGVKIGDSVYITVGNQTRKYIITASYQTMNNLGKGLRFSDSEQLVYAASMGGIPQIVLNEPKTEEINAKLKELFGDNIVTANEYIDENIGSISDNLDSATDLIFIIVLCIASLITFLVVRSFIIRERGEIAMLKSIGFKNSTIRLWHIMRIVIVMVISTLIAALISIPLNLYVITIPFKMMGVMSVDIVVKPLEVYILYPLIILAAAVISTLFGTAVINKISTREVNNIE